MNNTNPVGRPLKNLNDLPQNWKLICQEMGQEGMFDVDLRVKLGITKDTFYSLLQNEPEFSEAVSEFRELSHTWWSSIPRKGFKNGESKNLNSNLYSLIMRNRFKDEWNAEKKVDITTGGDKLDSNNKIQIEILKTKIEEEPNE
jgi:hypothetical protein